MVVLKKILCALWNLNIQTYFQYFLLICGVPPPPDDLQICVPNCSCSFICQAPFTAHCLLDTMHLALHSVHVKHITL